MQIISIISKWMAVGIILLFVGSCIVPAIAQDIKRQSSRGNWLYVGGNGPENYTKIQDALNNASEGDTIFVFSGIYIENIEIHTANITLLGENKITTVIDGGSESSKDVIVINSANNVMITGFTIENSSWYGVSIGSQSIIITGNIICFNDRSGIIIGPDFSCTIEENTIHENRNGIDVTEGGSNVNIVNNTIFTNNYHGIAFLGGGTNCTITGNTIENNSEGIWIYNHCSNNTIKRNTIRNNNDTGLLIEFHCDNNRIEENNFINNCRHAQDVLDFRGNIWTGNYWDNWIGVKLQAPLFQKFPKLIKFCVFDWHPAQEPYDIPGMK